MIFAKSLIIRYTLCIRGGENMKKLIVLITIVSILLVANTVYADTAFKKLWRGVVNFVTSPLEIGNGISDAYDEHGILIASTWGVMDGFLRFGGRALCGVYETLTFPLPAYDPIIKNPEFLL